MVAGEENIRCLKDTRVLLLHLLEKNNATKFYELLAQHPEYIQMHCSADDDQVSI